MSSLKQRSHPRIPCQVPVRVSTGDGVVVVDGTTVNVGLGGVSLESDPPLAFQSAVRVQFRVPGVNEEVVTDGTVRWVKGTASGIQFTSLRAREVWAINQLLRTVA